MNETIENLQEFSIDLEKLFSFFNITLLKIDIHTLQIFPENINFRKHLYIKLNFDEQLTFYDDGKVKSHPLRNGISYCKFLLDMCACCSNYILEDGKIKTLKLKIYDWNKEEKCGYWKLIKYNCKIVEHNIQVI